MSRKGTIFPRGFREGDPLARRGVNKGLNLMAKFWETLDIADGHIDWSNDRPLIVPPSTNEHDPTKHYFLVVRDGTGGVMVNAGATQTIGGEIEMRAGQPFDGLTGSVWIYAHHKINTGDWDTTGQGFLKTAATLPTSDGENDYRPIAYITVEGDPYTVTEIEQAHVGVLREPQLPAGSEDGEIAYWDEEAEKWTVLSAPIEKSVLMYDPEAEVGSKLQWVEVDTFTCEE